MEEAPHQAKHVMIKELLFGPGTVAQVVRVLALHARDPIWVPVLIPAAPLPIQLPACGLGKQWRTAQSLGTLHLRGKAMEDGLRLWAHAPTWET